MHEISAKLIAGLSLCVPSESEETASGIFWWLNYWGSYVETFFTHLFFFLFAALGPKIWSELQWIKNKSCYFSQVILRALKKILLIMKFLFLNFFFNIFPLIIKQA